MRSAITHIIESARLLRKAAAAAFIVTALAELFPVAVTAQTGLQPLVPKAERGRSDAERSGMHDAGNIRTVFYNFGMVGDYPADPINVDLSVFHSAEVPKGTGMNYTDGITPFVLAHIVQRNGIDAYIMETGYRERQEQSPYTGKIMRYEPRPGFFQADPGINVGRSIAISSDRRTWPNQWPDKLSDTSDPGWTGSWDGYFGKRPNADQESFFVMDDDFYDKWDYYPDTRDATRRGLGLRVEVRGFQWANPQATNVIFWHYDVTNEGTTDYDDNIIFGLYMDSGVGGETYSCDGVAESDDDNAYFDRSIGLNMTYTWDQYGHGVDLRGNCAPTGYLGYAYLETPGNPFDGIDNDDDGITDEKRDSVAGTLIVGQDNIRAYVQAHYDMQKFETFYGKLETRPAFKAGRWWTGDEDMDWVADYDDVGADGVPGTHDYGEGDGRPTQGEPDFGQTDKDESDQIGLTGFKMNRIKGPTKADPVDDIVFFGLWPPVLYAQFTNPDLGKRFDSALVLNYNIAFLFASGTFKLPAGDRERFSLALAYGANLDELRTVVKTVQQIYNANYQFAVPPPLPLVNVEVGDKKVRLSWSDFSERGIDPITHKNDFEGYKVYRSTDADFLDPKVITNALGTGTFGNGKPIAQYDLINGVKGFSTEIIQGVAYWLGDDSGLQHTYEDTQVVDGQDYYYAVCAYDHGDDSLGFYPSENPVSVSRTLRGGTILATNVVEARPEPKVPGYVPASTNDFAHIAGTATAAVDFRVVDSKLVPDQGTYELRFYVDSARHVHANRYAMVDSTTQKEIFSYGTDFHGEGRGPVGLGILPVVSTPDVAYVDSSRSGFMQGSVSNARFKISNISKDSIDIRRPGYPYDLTVTFSNVPLDTSILSFGAPAVPAKILVTAGAPGGPTKLWYILHENPFSRDSTLSLPDEYVDVVWHNPGDPPLKVSPMWRIQIDTTHGYNASTFIKPGLGDVWFAKVASPVSDDDIFTFRTNAAGNNPTLAKQQYKIPPYVVPNPYTGAASFEPQRFAVSGRGERRMEFRQLPVGATVRIYDVRGNIVQTLYHDRSDNAYVAWNLRTKDDLDVAPGLYIFQVEAPGYDAFIGKFAIIK